MVSSSAPDQYGSDQSGSSASEIFAAFCGAGLWPGLGKTLRDKFPANGILTADDVTEEALASVQGLSARRAATLMVAFARARPKFDVVALLLPAGLPARLWGGARSTCSARAQPASCATIRGGCWTPAPPISVRPIGWPTSSGALVMIR